MGSGDDEEDGGTPVYDIAYHHWGYTATEKRDATFLSAFTMAMILAMLISSLLGRKQKIIPEACVILTVGLVLGFVCKGIYAATKVKFFTRPLLGFDNTLFFLGLLPPIIYQSGFDLRPSWLFGLFGPILLYALAGTFISAVVVGASLALVAQCGLVGHRASSVTFAETLTFGALISATDPVSVLAVFTELRVDPKMFYLVFGESVLNDAVGIVLFKAFSKYVGHRHSLVTLAIAAVDFIVIFAGSMLLGLTCAVFIAGLLKLLRVDPPHVDSQQDDKVELPQTKTRAGSSSSPNQAPGHRELPAREHPPDEEKGDDVVVTLEEEEEENEDDKKTSEENEEKVEGARHMQLAVLVVSVWVPSFVAELVELSGIVATLFCAVGVRHWGLPNLQERDDTDDSAEKSADAILGTLAHLADTAVFLYLGLSVPAAVDDWRQNFSISFVAWALVACIVGRFLNVYPLSKLANRQARNRILSQYNTMGRSNKRAFTLALESAQIPTNMQHMLFFSGLRGAVAFSCANIFPNDDKHKALFEVTTTTLIIISMYVLGALTVPTLRYLQIQTHVHLGRDDADDDDVVPVRNRRASSTSSVQSTGSGAGSPRNAPKPIKQLRTMARIADEFITPALVGSTPRTRRRRMFSSHSPANSDTPSDEPLNPLRDDGALAAEGSPPDELEMVGLSHWSPDPRDILPDDDLDSSSNAIV